MADGAVSSVLAQLAPCFTGHACGPAQVGPVLAFSAFGPCWVADSAEGNRLVAGQTFSPVPEETCCALRADCCSVSCTVAGQTVGHGLAAGDAQLFVGAEPLCVFALAHLINIWVGFEVASGIAVVAVAGV